MNKTILALAAAAGFAMPACAAVYTPVTGDPSYKLTFDDEFNGTAISTTAWQVTYDGNPDHTYQTYNNAYFWPSTNAKVANGVLELSVTKSGNTYRTAALTTQMLQKYGYWEARLKVPANARGIGTNFWHDSYNWNFPEIDTFEWSGGPAVGGADCYSTSYIDTTGNWGTPTHPCGVGTAWHVYGMLWTPTAITFYMDGVQKAVISNYNTTNLGPMWTLLSATVGPWGDLVDGSTVFPSRLQVDYVHIYSNDPSAVAVTPQANYGGPGADGTAPSATVLCTPTISPVTVTVGGAAVPMTATLRCQ